MKLSVVIVNYNVEHFLEQCLKSVQAAVKNIDAEVFIVDNDSVDGSCEMVKEKFPEFTLIESKENLGFSKGNNLAIRKSVGEYVLLLNPDTLVEEDTFTKVCDFMDGHPDAGGLGVNMVDGNGEFLPESKRGLPTPAVAFYKIFGLSSIFPKSKRFGAYHLGHLDKNETHEIEILSGAFMLMRKTALDKVGLLDEKYFMYGEDIDLSYRLLKGGYKNYYFAGTKIIHYKGESTKKGSLNYVKVFYKAMIIFAETHFSNKNAKMFSLLINSAIYLRAGLAITKRIIDRSYQAIIDFLLILLSLMFFTDYWEKYHRYYDGGEYPELFTNVVIPVYILFWITGIYLNGGYDKESKISANIKGGIFGSLMLFIAYGLVPEHLRFSRALMLLGSASAIAVSSIRFLLIQYLKTGRVKLDDSYKKRILIVGNTAEKTRVQGLLNGLNLKPSFIGTAGVENKESADLGNFDQLKDVVRIYEIDEVIFCAADISSETIINTMADDELKNVHFKIAPPESMFIIGSHSIHTNGEMYTVDINGINNAQNKRNKRLLDLSISVIALILSPVLIIATLKPLALLRNIFLVLFGFRTWVGYDKEISITESLPKIKEGIISPSISFKNDEIVPETVNRINALYAKDYQINNDLRLIWKGIRKLGS